MSAEILRRAAALMRERAQAVDTVVLNEPGWGVTWEDCIRFAVTDPDGTYLASWHPKVALAVADLIEHVADRHEQHTVGLAVVDSASEVASAYLGDES